MDENTNTILVSDLEPTGGDPAEMKADGEGGTPPDLPEGGTPPDGAGGGSSSSSSVTWTGATEITRGGTYPNQTYTSTTANQNALLVNTSDSVTLTNPTVTKSGDGDGGDNTSFYGTNAGVLVKGGSTTTINGGTVTTSASGANGVFSYGGNGGQNGASGDGTTVDISNVTIKTTGDASGGIMTTGGGVTKASNLTITTTGQSSAPIRTDRGGGSVTVSGGSYTSSGLGSPAIYSTADITVENATLTSNLSEGVCIEGQNSVALTNCTLTANNTKTNGNAQFLDAVILYQSMSGDAASGTAAFSMTGGKLVNKSGHLFHVTNTNAVINLNDVDLDDSGDGVLLSVCDDGWSGASNVATLNASGQELTGDILVGDDSTLTLNLTGGTTFNGKISGAITNASGSSISSTVGTVNVSLDADSKWYLDGDAYISSFSGTAANVITNGHTLYVNNVALGGTTENDDSTPSTVTTALNVSNSVNNTLLSGSTENDTIVNSGSNVTILGGAGSDQISLSSAATGNVIQYAKGGGNDTVYGFNETSTLSIGGGTYSSATSGDNVVVTVGDDKVTLSGAANLDTVNIVGGTDTNAQGDAELATSLVGALLYRTPSGYPVLAGIALNPDVYHSDEPDNYASKENWTIESADGLELNAVHYTPEESNDKWVVIIHGYGHNHKHMWPFLGFYLDNGYNVLMVDQRAAGDSEGEWLTMGTAESADIALWTQEIARRNPNSKITLFGASMGAATAMLAAARSDTKNVTSLVEDCGYSNVVEVIDNLNNLIFKVDQPTVDLMQPVSESLTGYNLKDAAPINSISSVKVPTLFITGTNDSVVATSMLSALYDASGADVKETFYVEGANHGLAGLTDPVGYSNTVFRFIAEADGEGWETENIVNDISLRGTSYNDTITNSGTNVTIDALGGDDFLVNDVDSSVTTAGLGNSIIAGDGNDTIFNYHSYRPTLLGGDGNDYIAVSRGHMTYVDGGAGNDTILGRKADTVTGSDWEIGGYATVLGGEGNDYIDTGYTNSASIDGGAGNDTIYASGNRITINGGEGRNLIGVLPASLDADNACAYIVFSGNTTVDGFKTGFGNGSDTIYIPGDPAGVELKSSGLTFANGNDTLILDDVTTTAKVNIYHEDRNVLNKGVFIAANDWYSVESGDLSVKSGEEVYFVGTDASRNHGVDFSGISSNLNVTLDTAYIDSEDYVPGTSVWINNVYSIRGGAGNTTITGSDKSDTIIAGTGRTTIDGAGGNDRISLGSAQALVKFTSGGGNDSVYGFNANSTISIGGASYTSATSGSNLILTAGSDKITLFGAGSVDNPHILGTLAGGGSSSTTSGGGSSSTTSGGGSSSTTSGGGSSSTTSGGSSSSTVNGATSTTDNRLNAFNNTASSSTTGNSALDKLLGLSGSSSTSTTSGGSSTSTTSGSSSTSTTAAGDYVYSGGNAVISDYEMGEKIVLGTAPLNGYFVDSDLVVTSATGTLVVEDVTGKVVDFTDAAGNDYVKAYAAAAPGIIDGRGLAGFELIAGSDAGADLIVAGDGGSSINGGLGNDSLVGGAGTDIFVSGQNAGADAIANTETKDIINFNDATLSDIIATAEQSGVIAVAFVSGNVVLAQSTESLSAAFTLADGSAYRYNHAAKTWQSA